VHGAFFFFFLGGGGGEERRGREKRRERGGEERGGRRSFLKLEIYTHGNHAAPFLLLVVYVCQFAAMQNGH
jgi:hypothetical protein